MGEEKPVAFTLIVDATKARIINNVLNAAMSDSVTRAILEGGLEDKGIDLRKDFLEEWTQKYHEAGFCTDVKCKYPN